MLYVRALKKKLLNEFCVFLKERNIENVKSSRNERIREIQNSMYEIHSKLDEQFQMKLDALNGKIIGTKLL